MLYVTVCSAHTLRYVVSGMQLCRRCTACYRTARKKDKEGGQRMERAGQPLEGSSESVEAAVREERAPG